MYIYIYMQLTCLNQMSDQFKFSFVTPDLKTLRWRYNGRDCASNHHTSLTIAYSTVYSGADQSKHQSSASLAFVWGIHRGPVNSPHKWPVTRKMFPFDDVIMKGDLVADSLCSQILHQSCLSGVLCRNIPWYIESAVMLPTKGVVIDIC